MISIERGVGKRSRDSTQPGAVSYQGVTRIARLGAQALKRNDTPYACPFLIILELKAATLSYFEESVGAAITTLLHQEDKKVVAFAALSFSHWARSTRRQMEVLVPGLYPGVYGRQRRILGLKMSAVFTTHSRYDC